MCSFLRKFHLRRQFLMLDEVQYEFVVVDPSELLMIINNQKIYQLKYKNQQIQEKYKKESLQSI